MKFHHLIFLIALLLSGCNSHNIEIKGTALGKNGGIVTILDSLGKICFTEVIKADKFSIKENLPATGYYMLSVEAGPHPNDFEIYLEPGQYVIEVPKEEGEYLRIKTRSKTQQSLSTYYNFENNLSRKFRQEHAVWQAKLKDTESLKLTDAEFNDIAERVAAGRRREHGLHIAAMDMFIQKYPDNTIVPHIIGNMNYKTDPMPYYLMYNKLSSAAKNSYEGKRIGNELKALVK